MAIDRRNRDIVGSQVRSGVDREGPFASPRLVAAIRAAAAAWTSADGFPHGVDGLDDVGFDAALDASAKSVASMLGDDIAEFASDLRQEAMRGTRDDAGRTVSASLFAIPLRGDPDALDAFARQGGLQALGSSLLQHGVAAPGSAVLMAPGLARPADMVAALPGTIRAILNAGLDAPAAPGAGLLPDRTGAAVARLLATRPPNRAALPRALAGVGARVALGIRVLRADADGEIPIDYLGAFLPEAVARAIVSMASGGPEADPDESRAAPELDAWLADAAAATAPYGASAALPDHWSAATAMAGCLHLQHGLASAAAEAGLADAPVGAVHVRRGSESVSVVLQVGDVLLGPAAIPLCLVSGDPGQLERAMSAYDAPVAFLDDGDPFPDLAAA